MMIAAQKSNDSDWKIKEGHHAEAQQRFKLGGVVRLLSEKTLVMDDAKLLSVDLKKVEYHREPNEARRCHIDKSGIEDVTSVGSLPDPIPELTHTLTPATHQHPHPISPHPLCKCLGRADQNEGGPRLKSADRHRLLQSWSNCELLSDSPALLQQQPVHLCDNKNNDNNNIMPPLAKWKS